MLGLRRREHALSTVDRNQQVNPSSILGKLTFIVNRHLSPVATMLESDFMSSLIVYSSIFETTRVGPQFSEKQGTTFRFLD
ncbi:hypothetical protein A5757_18435 [Mycobacterium sp. 852013-51886_SCH5428379]|nr:hypothetical protein A5757_18435 [Mycobacterium sp. 852013-51886_SCH5428379]